MSRSAFCCVVALALAGCRTENHINDAGEPKLTLTEPVRAEWMSAGQTEVSGEWAALSAIQVNDQDVETTGSLSGTYSGTVDLSRGINIVTASGKDGYGDLHYTKNHVIAGEYVGPRQAVNKGAVVRINEPGLAAIMDAVEEQLDDETLASFMVSDFPVYEGGFIEYGANSNYLVEARLYIDDVSVSFIDLSVIPQEDELLFTASIHGLDLDTQLQLDLVNTNLLDIDLAVEADSIDITGVVTMSAYQGVLDVQLLSSTVGISGFYFDSDLIPTNIEGQIFGPMLEGFVEDQVAIMLESQITDLMRDTLSAFDFSYTTELMGRQLSVDAEFARATIDPAGVELTMSIDVDMPNTTEHPYTGVLTAPGRSPTPDATADVSMSLWDDLLNKMLFEAWRSELLVQNLSSEDGSLSPIALLALHADSATVQVDGKLPPVIVQGPDGQIEAQIGALEVVLDMQGSDLGSHLEATVGVNVDLDVNVVNGVLAVQLGTPVLDVMARNSDWGASNETLSAMLLDVLPMNLILSLIGDLEFPLPELPGLTLTADAGRDANGTHTAVRLSLRAAQQ